MASTLKVYVDGNMIVVDNGESEKKFYHTGHLQPIASLTEVEIVDLLTGITIGKSLYTTLEDDTTTVGDKATVLSYLAGIF